MRSTRRFRLEPGTAARLRTTGSHGLRKCGDGACQSLNEYSVWSGGPCDRNNPDALRLLPELRRLIHEGKLARAHELAADALAGTPDSMRFYEPLASTTYRREYLANAVDGVIAIRMSTDRPGAVSGPSLAALDRLIFMGKGLGFKGLG